MAPEPVGDVPPIDLAGRRAGSRADYWLQYHDSVARKSWQLLNDLGLMSWSGILLEDPQLPVGDRTALKEEYRKSKNIFSVPPNKGNAHIQLSTHVPHTPHIALQIFYKPSSEGNFYRLRSRRRQMSTVSCIDWSCFPASAKSYLDVPFRQTHNNLALDFINQTLKIKPFQK